MSKSTLLVSTAVGLTLAVAGPSYAAHPSSHAKLPAGAKTTGLTGSAAIGNGPAKAGILVEDWATFTGTAIAFSFHPYDNLAGKCASKSGKCLIVTENLAQVNDFHSGLHQHALCPVVNATYTNGSCFYSGPVEQGFYSNIENRTNITVGVGAWAATDKLFSSDTVSIAHHQSDYTTYKL